MEKFFKVKEKGSTVRTELLAGLTTFMAMAYILMVNAGMFSDLGTVSYNAIYIATALSAVIGTVLIGLLANLPLAQASGMGLNAFFVYTVCFGFGLSYANALVLVLLDGVIFIVLTVTGLRKKIFEAIPQCVRVAIPALPQTAALRAEMFSLSAVSARLPEPLPPTVSQSATAHRSLLMKSMRQAA